MNNVHAFLSDAILALSTATILLTLLSYLVFKIKQLPQSFNQRPIARPTQGVFFNRYDPFPATLAAMHEDSRAIPFVNYRPFWARSAPAFFAVLTLTIFVTLGSEQYFNTQTISHARKTRALHYQEVKQLGLLQNSTFDGTQKNIAVSEWISPQKKEALKTLIGNFKDRRIGVVGTAWGTYFTSHGLVSSQSNWKDFSRYEAILIDHVGKLDESQKAAIDSALADGRLVVAAGLFGGVNDPWVEKTFGIHLVEASDHLKYPTLVKGDGAPGWNLTAGTMLDWFPGSAATVAVKSELVQNAEIGLYEANFEGRFVQDKTSAQKVVREIMVPAGRGRAIWLGVQPDTIRTEDAYAADEIVFSSLSWGLKNIDARVTQWKNAATAAIAFSVDSEDQFEGAQRLRKLFESENVPASFFIVSDLLEADPRLVKDAKPNMDYASHTAAHGILEGLTLYDQFKEVERSRMAIEELAGRKVRGFRPPEERYDEATLNAALQAHYEYFFGDQRLHRFGPVSIAEGKLTYFPRSNLDDVLLMGDHAISDEKDMAHALNGEMNRIASVHGAYLLSMHSQYFGQDPFYASVETFIESLKNQRIWQANFAELCDWAKARDQLRIEKRLDPSIGKIKLSVTNPTAHELTEVGVWINAEVTQVSDPTVKLVDQSALGSSMVFPVLPAHGTTTVTLSSSEVRAPAAVAATPAPTISNAPAKKSAKLPAKSTGKSTNKSGGKVMAKTAANGTAKASARKAASKP